jgi:hypothetical protein
METLKKSVSFWGLLFPNLMVEKIIPMNIDMASYRPIFRPSHMSMVYFASQTNRQSVHQTPPILGI